MFVDSQLAQLNNRRNATVVRYQCRTRQCSVAGANRRGSTCFANKNESESCLVKAPAKHASESVLVVGELLCTSVQAKTRETHKEGHARNVLMLGIQTTQLRLFSKVKRVVHSSAVG